MSIIVDHQPVGAFQMNAWVCGDSETGDGVLIDAGAEPATLERLIARNNLTIHAILQTHGHLDHAGAVKPMVEAHPDWPVLLHRDELPIWANVASSARAYGLGLLPQPDEPDRFIEDGELLRFGSVEVRVLFLPGHTPGGVAFIIGGHIFVGDTLFMGSVGRTDLPLGDTPTLARSLIKLMEEDDSLVVHSGHGPDTTIGQERQRNPFVQAALRGQVWM